MKKQLFSLALLLGLAGSFAGSSLAADFGQDHDKNRREQRQDRDKDGRKDRDQGHRQGRGDQAQRQQRLDRMAKELDLSKKQREKVAKIFQEQQQQMQALRGRAQGTDRGQLRGEAQRIHASTDQQLKDVLSKKQYAQLEAQRQERLKQLQQRRGDHRPDGRKDFKQGRS
jgi:Spy/CpxP family protein refolding chaperone